MAELKKFFNVNGSCNPQIHYMIDLSERLSEIKKMVDAGEYFTINRADSMERQHCWLLWQNI